MIAPTSLPRARSAAPRGMHSLPDMLRTSQRASRNGDWRWLSEVSSVVVEVDNGKQRFSFGVDSTPGFVRVVDRNALGIDIPRNGALQRALSQSGRAPGITLWCLHPVAGRELVCLEGVGSVGPACAGAHRLPGAQVCLRMTAFTVSSQFEAPQPLNIPEAS